MWPSGSFWLRGSDGEGFGTGNAAGRKLSTGGNGHYRFRNFKTRVGGVIYGNVGGQGKSRQSDLGNAWVKGTHDRIHVEPVQAKRFKTEVEQCARNSYGQQIFHWPLVFRLR